MIRLQRARTPDAIPAAVRGRTRIGRNLELLRAAQVAATFEFKPGYWKDGKARLKAETHGKCAYCESKIDTVAHGDVEHFRPKSVYWWLAYCYDNHLYACQICNQVFKKDRFPVRRKMRPPRVAANAGEGELRAVAAAMTPDPVNEPEGMSWAAYAARCRAENPGLPDPYLTDPEPLMAWEADEIQKRVLVKPRGGSARALKDFQAMEECFGLNREELAGWRYQTYRALRVLCMYLERLPKDDALRRQTVQEILRMRSDRSAYAGMVRYFLAEWGVSLG